MIKKIKLRIKKIQNLNLNSKKAAEILPDIDDSAIKLYGIDDTIIGPFDIFDTYDYNTGTCVELGETDEQKLKYILTHKQFAKFTKEIIDLINYGIDINITNSSCESILIKSCCKPDEASLKLVKKCIKYGSNINLQNNFGRTALFYLANQKKKYHCVAIKLMLILLDAGANVNIMDEYNNTVLIMLMKNNDIDNLWYDIIMRIIDMSDNIQCSNNNGKNAYYYYLKSHKNILSETEITVLSGDVRPRVVGYHRTVLRGVYY